MNKTRTIVTYAVLTVAAVVMCFPVLLSLCLSF